jgi:two-component system, OmpR family, response regulator
LSRSEAPSIEPKPHIAVVDDDQDIRDSLGKYLTRAGYRVSTAADGAQLDKLLATANLDLIVLDIMLPDEDGLSICRRLQLNARVPVILLTALSEEIDRIVGLELGADDYLAKPFNPREMLARIKSVLRRAEMLPRPRRRLKGAVRFGHWTFDYLRKEVSGANGIAVRLSSGEHLLLASLIEHAGIVLTRDQLLDLTRGRDAQLFDRSIDMQVSRLRRKLQDDGREPRIIVTHWGGGYLFAAEVDWAE